MAGARKNPSSSGRYQGFFINQHGKKQYFTGSKKRSETITIARKLEDDARQVRLGYRDPKSNQFRHKDDSIAETIESYIEWGLVCGRKDGRPWSPYHAKRKRTHLDRWVEALGLEVIGDLNGFLPKVKDFLQDLASQGKSTKTQRNIAEALVSFCHWCVKQDVLGCNPLDKLDTIQGTPEVERRPFTAQDIQKLMENTKDHLKILYTMAMCTGLRANELQSLTRDHLDVKRGGLWLQTEWTKNRKPTFQPLSKRVIEQLLAFYESGAVEDLYRKYLRSAKIPDDALLYVPTHTSRTLERDLDRAGIPKDTADGKLDFHSFRVTYATLVDGSGATAKEARELCRHSDPKLTFERYVKADNERLHEVADKVADKVLAENLGANMVHIADEACANENGKSLVNKELTANLGDWRRGDSNPRPVMFQDKRLHV